jgi:hypothetical protein
MGEKIITKTDRQMEDRMLAVAADPERADTLQKARAFKRTWLELAQALSKIQSENSWERWGFADFDSYCKKELHLRGSTVAKLLGSYRFLETSAPRIVERARADHYEAPIPSMAAVEYVKRATEKGGADEETLQTMTRVAFEEGGEVATLKKEFGELVFPVTDAQRKDRARGAISSAARKLSALVAEPDSPVPRKLAIRVEELVGELLETIEN